MWESTNIAIGTVTGSESSGTSLGGSSWRAVENAIRNVAAGVLAGAAGARDAERCPLGESPALVREQRRVGRHHDP